MEVERRSHATMISHWVSHKLIRNLTSQAFTESPIGLVGLEGSFDFTTSDEHGCGDLASHECSADVVLFSFDFVSFKTHTWLRNILSNCSFCALRASSSLSRELFSEFKSSLSYKNETDNTSSATLVHKWHHVIKINLITVILINFSKYMCLDMLIKRKRHSVEQKRNSLRVAIFN